MLSVIIPNYNHARYLNQRIESVLNQTFQDLEVIILDDLSKDNSKEIIEKYKGHPKVSNIVYNEINSGSTFKQWEKGISLAKGEYIWIAESDDYADINFAESLMSIALENTEIGLIYCGSNLVNEENIIVGELTRDVISNNKNYYLNKGESEVENFFLFHPIVPNASAVIFKKENYYKVSNNYTKLKISGDWLFWIEVCIDNYIAYLPNNLNYFRQSATSVSRSSHIIKNSLNVFYLERLKIIDHIYEMKNSNFKSITFRNALGKYCYHLSLDLITGKLKIDKEEKKIIYNFLKKIGNFSKVHFWFFYSMALYYKIKINILKNVNNAFR